MSAEISKAERQNSWVDVNEEANEVFEIVDYTLATPFEKFAAQLEDELRSMTELDAEDTRMIDGFDGNKYEIHRYVPKKESFKNSIFSKSHHEIKRWADLDEFIYVYKSGTNPSSPMNDLEIIKQLCSAICLAIRYLGLSLPVFLQVGPGWRNLYWGFQLTDENIETRFKTTHIPYTPSEYENLEQICELFKTKFFFHSSKDIQVSAQFTYELLGLDEDIFQNHVIDLLGDSGIRFGSKYDPISAFTLYAEHDYLGLHDAIKKSKEELAALDDFSIKYYLHADIETLDHNRFASFGQQVSQALEKTVVSWVNCLSGRQTSAKSFESALISSLKSRGFSQGISIVDINDIKEKIYDIFLNDSLYVVDAGSMNDYIHPKQLAGQLINSSGSPYKSFLWRFCVSSIEMLQGEVGKEHFIPSLNAILEVSWKLLMVGIRLHWENRVKIPQIYAFGEDYQNSIIDTRYNVICQKLMMINFCIEQDKTQDSTKADWSTTFWSLFEKRLESENSSKTEQVESLGKYSEDTDSSDFEDDEFYDTVEDFVHINENINTQEAQKPVGIKELMNSQISLSSGKPLNIPETQDAPYMTIDQVYELQKLFEDLGTSDEAALKRANLQSEQLISDMEAFKAANPGCCLEDFVRWHSPRDWIEDQQVKHGGRLSNRMLEEGNLWQKLWKQTQSIPASSQKPLFDAKKQAEAALAWLENIPEFSLINMIIPTIFIVAYDSLYSILMFFERSESLKSIIEVECVRYRISNLVKTLSKIPWIESHSQLEFDVQEIETLESHMTDVIECFRIVESMISVSCSLVDKFGYSQDHQHQLARLFVEKFLNEKTNARHTSPRDNAIPIHFKAVSNTLKPMFISNSKRSNYLAPVSRQFKLRKKHEAKTNQVYDRMHVETSKSEFHLFEVHNTTFNA